MNNLNNLNNLTFESNVCTRGTFHSKYSDEQIQDEPMFYRCDLDFALNHGGLLTLNFLLNLPEDYLNCDLTIDSRVHMLKEGWCPCIPGWHHDDVPRTRSDGQPDYFNNEYKSTHLMGLVNADIAPTEFAIGSINLEVPPEGSVIYKEWNPLVQAKVDSGELQVQQAESGVYYEFDRDAFHQGVPAVKSGWRWFMRVSKNTNRALQCKNVIRKQVQIYVKDFYAGW